MECKSCNEKLASHFEFCPVCGGKVIHQRLSVKLILMETFERYFSYDSKLFMTIKSLFTNPSDVINGYINGSRGKYLNPITLVIIALTLSGFQLYLMKNGFFGFDIEEMINPFHLKKSEIVDQKSIFEKATEYHSIIVFGTIPIMAFFSKLVFWKNKNFNYAEHMVVFGYAYPQFSIFSVLINIIAIALGIHMILISLILNLIGFGYFVFVINQVFKLDALQTILKTLLFIGITIGIMIVISIIIALFAIAMK